MSSWEAISNYMSERQENRDMGQNDHIRMGEQGFVYTDRQPYELTEDQPDEYGLPGVITAGGGPQGILLKHYGERLETFLKLHSVSELLISFRSFPHH